MTTFSVEYYYSSLQCRASALLSLLLTCISFLWPTRDVSANHRHRRGAEAVRESLHVVTYGEAQPTTCAVCLSEVRQRDSVRLLRNCRHVFHVRCLDRWLDHDDRLSCPLCRAPLHATVAATATAEPSWAVERLLYLFGDDIPFPSPSCYSSS